MKHLQLTLSFLFLAVVSQAQLFAPVERLDHREMIPHDFLSEDIDGDGDVDLLWVSKKGVYFSENLGSTFADEVQLLEEAASYFSRVAFEDLNGDGTAELIV